MAVILLKNISENVNILEQQNSILAYAAKNRIPIERTEIETSDTSKVLEERTELKGFLRSLNHNMSVIIYDFWVISSDVGELVKVIKCFMERNITLHVYNKKEIIDVDMPPLTILTILAKERENKKEPKESLKRGRPVGRMSQSKFDQYRSQIISLLEEKTSVSKIAQVLGVSRTSLKDYINSRNLKTLAQTKKELLGATPKRILRKAKKIKKCDLIVKEKKS